nr:MAG TPA: hypothetical protein [Caudoviricetes sp.]
MTVECSGYQILWLWKLKIVARLTARKDGHPVSIGIGECAG